MSYDHLSDPSTIFNYWCYPLYLAGLLFLRGVLTLVFLELLSLLEVTVATGANRASDATVAVLAIGTSLYLPTLQ